MKDLPFLVLREDLDDGAELGFGCLVQYLRCEIPLELDHIHYSSDQIVHFYRLFTKYIKNEYNDLKKLSMFFIFTYIS